MHPRRPSGYWQPSRMSAGELAMSEWIAQARAAVQAGERLAMVTVLGAQGSTPREIGARMLVWEDHFTGTIGGGSLERQALDQARKLIAQDARRHALQDYPL